MHAAGEVLWSFESALDKRLVDDHLGGDVRWQGLTSLRSAHLEYSFSLLRPRVDPLLQHCYRCEVPGERHIRADEYAIPAGHRQTHALIVGGAQADGKAASFHF